MLRLDAQLGAAVRATLSRSGGSAKERAAALLALQLRVAALLEDWLKKVGAGWVGDGARGHRPMGGGMTGY
jgi:hypothetical protein